MRPRASSTLCPNATAGDANPDGSPKIALAEVPSLAIFFSAFGTEEFPVRNLSFVGLTFTGGRPTFMDPHGQPSGGDWALERMGVLLLEGTEDAAITDSLFTRIDGNAVFLSGYNRRAAVLRNEFSLLGQNAIASWGRSVDYDGTGGQQPRHSLIAQNIAHDLGFEQKQSSFYFQAQTCETTLAANIVRATPTLRLAHRARCVLRCRRRSPPLTCIPCRPRAQVYNIPRAAIK